MLVAAVAAVAAVSAAAPEDHDKDDEPETGIIIVAEAHEHFTSFQDLRYSMRPRQRWSLADEKFPEEQGGFNG